MEKSIVNKTGELEFPTHDHVPSHIVLIPEPSESPQDPLNWSLGRKLKILSLLCLAAFCGNVAPLSGQLAYPVQAPGYHVTAIQSSYSVSAAIAGLATGAILFAPLGQLIGRWSITFWSLLGCLACAIWSARMTSQADYVPFIISRLISGFFGAIPSAVGGGMILDIFFLHQRGRAFICYEMAIIFGATAGPTFSGFIAGKTSWTICFWWTVPLLALTAIAVFLLAEETSFDRHFAGKDTFAAQSRSWVSERLALFFPGSAAVKKSSAAEFTRTAFAPVLIAISPATILTGVFTLIVFGWVLLNDVLGPTFLQTPIAKGGYGFTPIQNGAFTFSGWVAIICAQVIGYFITDSIPLWICRKYYNGVWRPELRLWVFTFSLIFTPVGMGICGAALHNHYHYMVFAFGYFVVGLSGVLVAPIATNYVAESFTHYGTESTMVMTLYRLGWGVAIPFFAEEWIEEVGINWVYGIAAFTTIASFFCIAVLLWQGPRIRTWSPVKSLTSSEEGLKLFRA